jgi:outer membrane lipoprotein SlyB
MTTRSLPPSQAARLAVAAVRSNPMKKTLLAGVLLVVSCGCDTMSNTDKGLLGGGALGAGAGALIGSATGHAGAGALIGGAAGAVGGALVGNAADHKEARDQAVAAAAAANARPMVSLPDVVRMTQQHLSDAVIIQQIRETYSVYNLTPDDVVWLKQQGVSDAVVIEMQSRRPGTVYVPAGYQRPVYVVEPEPAPVAVGVGFGWGPRHYWR